MTNSGRHMVVGVEWYCRAIAGDSAAQLAYAADEVDAVIIIVGTHRPGRWASMREFLNGPVTVHLAHRQHRPVVVIPLHPAPDGSNLPWDDGS